MKKVIIIGCPGSGKSTFARKLHEKLSLPLFHLDMLYWNKDRTTVTKDLFFERLNDAMSKPGWIIDGNYNSTMEMRMSACDTVFFLDYPTSVCLEGIEARKGKSRPDMPWTERGDYDKEFIDFIKSYNSQTRPEVIKLLEKYSSKNIIIFHSRNDADEYLSSVNDLFLVLS
jgi:adenylate kinase family enzyme